MGLSKLFLRFHEQDVSLLEKLLQEPALHPAGQIFLYPASWDIPRYRIVFGVGGLSVTAIDSYFCIHLASTYIDGICWADRIKFPSCFAPEKSASLWKKGLNFDIFFIRVFDGMSFGTGETFQQCLNNFASRVHVA